MKNHRYLAVGGLLIAIVAVTLWAASVQGQSSGNQRATGGGGLINGRFFLYQGSYDLADDKNKDRTATSLFKIDTANGRVWRYEETATDNADGKEAAVKSKWVSIDSF